MKVSKLVLIVGLFSFYGLGAMQQPSTQSATLEGLPGDIKRLIMEELIEVDPMAQPDTTLDLEASIKNITNLAQVNMRFHDFINQPNNMILLVDYLVYRFPGRYKTIGKNRFLADRLYIAKGLGNMPGIKSTEFKKWIGGFELIDVAFSGDEAKIKELLGLGVDVNTRNQDGTTALLAVLSNAGWRESEDTIRRITNLLMNAGADVNVQNATGYTPIFLATMYQKPELMREILKYNPDLTLADVVGQTPLHMAVGIPNAEIMKILMEHAKTHNIEFDAQLTQWIKEHQEEYKESPKESVLEGYL